MEIKDVQLNKTYSIIINKKEYNTSNEYEKKFLVKAIFNDRVVLMNTSYSSRGDYFFDEQTYEFDKYSFKVSPLLEQDFTDEFLMILNKEIENQEKTLVKMQKNLKERKQFIQNRTFLGKILTFYK